MQRIAAQPAQVPCSRSFVSGIDNTIGFMGRAAVTLKDRPDFRRRNEKKRERTPWMT
jgi:hypothetical protein